MNYLISVKQLPTELGPALVELAATEEDPTVAKAAADALPAATRANPALANLVRQTAEKSQALADQVGRVEGLRAALNAAKTQAPQTAQGVITLGPCHGPPGLFGIGTANCDEASARRELVCASVPTDAKISNIQLSTRWAGDADWKPVAPGQDAEWARFAGERIERLGKESERGICWQFTHWSSHREREARITVTYAF
jgi:hypothetical protein